MPLDSTMPDPQDYIKKLFKDTANAKAELHFKLRFQPEAVRGPTKVFIRTFSRLYENTYPGLIKTMSLEDRNKKKDILDSVKRVVEDPQGEINLVQWIKAYNTYIELLVDNKMLPS
ncbi:hypothetical protein [Methanocella sp. MCL-LM]|uniref:hypothetical protein n=1 Tax=Methanocella sp. MCL-LM TaxID=3412035 RepID=UPI003C76F22A